MASLIFTEGPQKGRKFSLGQSNLIMLGRDASCSIQILDSTLSRHHLQISWDASSGTHQATDFDSHNGVYVNGERIEKSSGLSDGDVIEIGSSKIVYTAEEFVDSERLHDVSRRYGQGHIHTQLDND